MTGFDRPANGSYYEPEPKPAKLGPAEVSVPVMMDADAAGVGEGDPEKAPEKTPEPPPRGEPVFEVVVPSSLAGVTEPVYHFRIWGDGQVSGFEKLGDVKRMLVMNRFPLMVEQLIEPLRNYVADVDAEIERIAPRAQGPAP
jgi:hypothetical protein